MNIMAESRILPFVVRYTFSKKKAPAECPAGAFEIR